MIETKDVVIVGAGLSGIGAAYHIQSKCPSKSFTVLEGRDSIGGTWDLFKYPGIRSDSDMYTLGFPWNPWKNPKAIADGPSILQYIKDTAKKFGIDKKIQFNHKLIEAHWNSDEKKWRLEIEVNEEEKKTIKAKFLFMTTGYYNYENGYSPAFPKSETFEGKIIHPQKWDTSLDYTNKKVVVIGSGATAVTIVPEMSKKAEKVTMLQRSPTYFMNLPSKDIIANTLNKILPSKMAYSIIKWKNILLSLGLYSASRKWPDKVRNFLQKGVENQLKDKSQIKHFKPKYDPWDQRLCLVPDKDFFKAMNKGKVAIETDTIKEFTKNGILLDSGKELEADIIITATGLQLQLLGGVTGTIDGKEIETNEVHSYKGVMFSDIPNFAIAIGYTNASWTLKCDLNCQYVARLINYMDKNGHEVCTPKFDPTKFESEPLLDFDAGYVKRAAHLLPKQGSEAPWKVHQNYLKDTKALKKEPIENDYLEFV